MNPKIKNFLNQSHVLDFSAHSKKGTCCCALFYAFIENQGRFCLAFKSSQTSKHVQIALDSKICSISIHNNEANVLKIKGAQIEANFIINPDRSLTQAYYTRFPYARLISGKIYGLEILRVKYTDNALKAKLYYEL